MHHQYICRVSILGFISVLSNFVIAATIFNSLLQNKMIISREKVGNVYMLGSIMTTLPLICALEMTKEKRKVAVYASTANSLPTDKIQITLKNLNKYSNRLSFFLISTIPLFCFLTPTFSKRIKDFKVFILTNVFGASINFALIAVLSYKTVKTLAPHLEVLVIKNKKIIKKHNFEMKKLERQNKLLNNLIYQEKNQLYFAIGFSVYCFVSAILSLPYQYLLLPIAMCMMATAAMLIIAIPFIFVCNTNKVLPTR